MKCSINRVRNQITKGASSFGLLKHSSDYVVRDDVNSNDDSAFPTESSTNADGNDDGDCFTRTESSGNLVEEDDNFLEECDSSLILAAGQIFLNNRLLATHILTK